MINPTSDSLYFHFSIDSNIELNYWNFHLATKFAKYVWPKIYSSIRNCYFNRQESGLLLRHYLLVLGICRFPLMYVSPSLTRSHKGFIALPFSLFFLFSVFFLLFLFLVQILLRFLISRSYGNISILGVWLSWWWKYTYNRLNSITRTHVIKGVFYGQTMYIESSYSFPSNSG